MSQVVFTLLMFFGGILFYLIRLVMFKMQIPNVIRVLIFIITFIPVCGLILNISLLLVNIGTYQKKSFYMTDMSQVRDTKLNRWLFEDVDWKEYDNYKTNNK